MRGIWLTGLLILMLVAATASLLGSNLDRALLYSHGSGGEAMTKYKPGEEWVEVTAGEWDKALDDARRGAIEHIRARFHEDVDVRVDAEAGASLEDWDRFFDEEAAR